MTTLWVTRVLLGVSQAALFPVAAMAVMTTCRQISGCGPRRSTWRPRRSGAALAPLLQAPTMEWFGWRAVFVFAAVSSAR